MKIFYSQYVLTGKDSQPSQAGALLKLEDGGAFGVADICPKPQFGDLSVLGELESRGPLFQRAHQLASEDLSARKNGVSLLQKKQVRNNILLSGYRAPEFVENVTYKIKADSDFGPLLDLARRLPKVRIDFNSKLSDREFDGFLRMLPPDLKSRIEYIEDPTVVSENWKEWNRIVPLAFDLQRAEFDPQLASYRIIKPSRQALPPTLENVIFTSSMDHPVGVAHGLRLAQRFSLRVAGFLTLQLFEQSGFNRYFEQNGNLLGFSDQALRETGIGMTAEIEAADWMPLA
jgi:O-succinylbenzoate synthase